MRTRTLAAAGALASLVVLATSCSSRLDEPAVGTYRAVATLPGGEAPFGLEVAKENNRYVIYLVNGAERTTVRDLRLDNGELVARFPGYENSLRAKMRRDALEGAITLVKAGGVEQVIPFEAKLGESYRFFEAASTDNADVAGRWSVVFTNAEGKTSTGVALFEQEHDRVTGTVMTPTGDHRFLAGQMRGNEVWLSTFAGGLVYLYKLKVDGTKLEGEYWQGLKSHEKVSASHDAGAKLEELETELKSERLEFTFNDVDGKPVSLSDERFKGKVVLVTIGGTWCPNCHDEALFLVPFYREYKSKGFEIVQLMFERHGDFAKAATAVRDYRDDFAIEFPILVAGVSDNDDASKKLPQLSGVYGYPTSIFVDKQGKVRKVHTGFTGPATGKHYEEYIVEFRELIDELLAEKS